MKNSYDTVGNRTRDLPVCSVSALTTTPPRAPRICNTYFSTTTVVTRTRLNVHTYRGADKSLARPPSRCILFDAESISFDASLVIYIYIYIYK